MAEIALRPWRLSDAPSLAALINNKRVQDNLRDGLPYPYTPSDGEDYIRGCLEAGEERQLCRAVLSGGAVVGSIGLFLKDNIYRRSAELGYFLGEEYWGRGLMSRAVVLLCEEAFARYDLVRIFAEPFAHNAGSRRVLEKAGFTLEGILRRSICKNNRVGDSCVYALLR